MVGGGSDVEDEDDIVPAMGVGDGEPDGLHHGDRLAAGKRHLLEVLDGMRAVASEHRNLAAVLDADDELTARRVSEGTNMLGNLPVILACAFAVPPGPRGAPKGRPTSLGANHGKQGSHHHEGA